MKKMFLVAVAALFGVSASAQYQHGLPVNEKAAKPMVLNVGRPYSYKAMKVYEGSGMKVEVYYDAKTHREYNKNISTGQVTLQIPETVDGKPVVTVYVIDHKAKACRVQMRLSGAIADTRESKRVEVWQGRWCDISGDSKWYTDMETGIVLYEKCDYVKTINIELGEQDASLFQLPEGYKTEVSGTSGLFEELQKKYQQGEKVNPEDLMQMMKQKQQKSQTTKKQSR